MIIAVDFDGTVSLGQYPDLGPVNSKLVRFLKQRKDKGGNGYHEGKNI